MTQAEAQVDLLITGCHIACVDAANTIIDEGAIGIVGTGTVRSVV